MAIQTLSFISLILRPWVEQEIDPNAMQLFPSKEDGKSYIYWKHTCTDNDK